VLSTFVRGEDWSCKVAVPKATLQEEQEEQEEEME